MSKLVKLVSYSSRAEADLTVDILKNSGLKAMGSSDGTGKTYGHLEVGPSEVMVNEEDFEKAKKVLDDYSR